MSETLAEVEATLERGGDPDDVLRSVVTILVETGGCTWAAILFREEGELVLGPQAGAPDGERTHTPVVYGGDQVAELVTAGGREPELLPRIAERIAVHCLVGWDTGGVPWEP